MNAKPRRHIGDNDSINEDFTITYTGDLRHHYAREPGTIVLECEIMQPPSSKGRTIYVYFQGDDLTDAMKLFRSEAIRARSKPMSESHQTTD